MNNICVVNVNWLGDAVFSLPVFKALRNAYPSAKITCICVPRVAEVVKFSPDIDQIIVMDEKGEHFWPWQKLAFIWKLRALRFDTAFILHPSLSRALIVWLVGIPKRIGFCKWPKLMTTHVPHQHQNLHRMDHYLRVVEAFGIPVNDRTYGLVAPNTSTNPRGKYVVFNLGGNWDKKRWPLLSWVQLAGLFQSEGIKIIFTGSLKDANDARLVIEQSGRTAENCCGQTTIGESLAIYSKAGVVISADSGPLHLAASVGVPTIGIFGPTRPEITGPRGRAKSRVLFQEIGCNKTPCYHLGCLDNLCMKGVSPKDVLQAYNEIVG